MDLAEKADRKFLINYGIEEIPIEYKSKYEEGEVKIAGPLYRLYPYKFMFAFVI